MGVGEALGVLLPGWFLYVGLRAGLGVRMGLLAGGNLVLGGVVVWGRGREGYGIKDGGED